MADQVTDLFDRVETLKADSERKRTTLQREAEGGRARFLAENPAVVVWLDSLVEKFGAIRRGFVDGYWERRGGWPFEGEGGPPPPERGRLK